MAASRALERGREGPQYVAAGTEQALQTIPSPHWEKHRTAVKLTPILVINYTSLNKGID